MHRNEFRGVANGPVVQSGAISNVHLHYQLESTVSELLSQQLSAATVVVGSGFGVRVARGLVLTCSELVDGEETAQIEGIGGGLVLLPVPGDDAPYACVLPAGSAGADLSPANLTAGSPLLSPLTGCVHALSRGDSSVVELPEIPELVKAARDNHQWLDLLTPSQLRAGGWRHAGQNLRHYLAAISRADQEHAYEMVNRTAPPLSAIYLNRQATRDSDGEDSDDGLPERVQADRLLEYHRGVQVSGHPGMGKSSLVRRMAAETARGWLKHGSGEFVPVLVPADVLLGRSALREALASGVLRWFSHHLNPQHLVDLFGPEPVPGVPWLVLVDGLDELLDPTSRRMVLKTIEFHRSENQYRFLLATRPLDRREFERIDRRRFPTYGMEAFTADELHEFAIGFLREHKHPAPVEGAAEFLARVRESKLRALAHVPLISTMLCTLFHQHPTAKMPDDQSQLYDEFVGWLKEKLWELDVRAKLRARVARYPGAEEAVDLLLERFDDLVKEVAYGHLGLGGGPDDRSLLDHAMAWEGVARPASVPEAHWREVLTEALRVSGLVTQFGQEFRFLHQTVQEYLAASHLAKRHGPHGRWARRFLAPQSKWPWPHLEVKVFLVAIWAKEADFQRPLRKLIRWGRWRHNAGFITALVRHGVELDEGVVRRVRRVLSKAVADANTDSAQWKYALAWLVELDSRTAEAELVKLAAPRDDHDGRRFEAVRELVSLDVRRAANAVRAFFDDSRVARLPRRAMARHLHDVDRDAAVQALTQTITSHHEFAHRRDTLEILLEIDEERGVLLLTRLAAGEGGFDPMRVEASKMLLSYDQVRGMAELAELVRNEPDPEDWSAAAAALLHHDAERTEELLVEIVDDAGRDIVRRYHAANLVAAELGHPAELPLTIAEDPSLPRDLRTQAASNQRASTTQRRRIVRDVLDRCAPGDPYRMEAMEALALIDGAAATRELENVVEDRKQRDATRMQAAARSYSLAGAHTAARFYGHLVRSHGVARGQRMEAAHAVGKFDPPAGAALLHVLVDDHSFSRDERMAAALDMARLDTYNGANVLLKLSKDRSWRAEHRLQAAEALRSPSTNKAQQAFTSLADDKEVSPRIRIHAACELKDKARAGKVLDEVATRAKHGNEKLEAATALLDIDRADGLATLRRLAASNRVPRRIRDQAAAMADRSAR